MSRLPISDLKQRYAEERYFGDNKTAAEYAYALAIRLQDRGEIEEAKFFATECLRLARALSTQSLEDVSCGEPSVGDVPMPEWFHDGVVRARLANLLPAKDQWTHAKIQE